MSLDKTIIGGNLTRDPEVRQVGENSVANFSVAVNRKYKTATGEKREEVTFIDCTAWGYRANFVGQWFRKGDGIIVEGRHRQEKWQAADNTPRTKLIIVADNIHFPPGGSGRATGGAPSGHPGPGPAAPLGDDEPPF